MHDFRLALDADGARVHCDALPGYAPLVVRFVRAPAGRGAAPLRRAIGGAATVVDATAGWGRDAARLASWGCRVTAVECHPLVAAALRHAHAKCDDDELRARLNIAHADSVAFLRAVPAADAPEAVYLDPMYPPQNTSAAAKKPLTMLRLLTGRPGDCAELFAAAMNCARRRVVVKRPPRAPPMAAGRAGAVAGKLARFDIYKPTAA